MSKIGIVEVGGLKKPIQLQGINLVQFNFNSIGIAYGYNNATFQWGNQFVFIQFTNPGNEATQAFIKQQFYKWLSEGLTASSPSVLNEYLPQVTITDVGVRGSIVTGNIVAAADLTTACAANPSTLVALDYAGGTIPPVGTYIYDPSKNGNGLPGPIDAGSYALSYGGQQFFITVNSSSLISSLEICPLVLDFVYNLQNLGAGPVFNANMDGISFSTRNFFPPGTSYGSYYGVSGLESEPFFIDACNIANNAQIYGSNNAMWPVGLLNNATANQPDFSGLDVAFGLSLADSNVANFDSAQLYISFDYNAAGAANASFQPFILDVGQNPAFPNSPGGGIPGFGDGTTSFTPGGDPNFFPEIFSQNVYLPAGNSLVGTASFTNGAYCQWDKNNGRISSVDDSNCPI